jgi:acetyltransferase-like isoleucine patch superfamily enzyme
MLGRLRADRPATGANRSGRREQEARMSTVDRLVARLLGRWLREPPRQVLAEQDPRQAGPQAHEELYKYLVHGDRARLHVHPTAVVNNALFNLGSGHITVGEWAFFGHNVSVLTGTHDIDKFGRERQLAIPRSGRDIVIGEGAWLASNVMVLGPCVIGAHAVVGGGSLVMGDVEPYTIVAGSPAKVLRTIRHDDQPG